MPSKPTLVLLVRHGTTPTTGKVLPGRARGLRLAENGKQQAERAAQRIAELGKIGALYSSPLERARDTAAPISRALRKPIRVDRGLLECDFGSWTGQSLARIPRTAQRIFESLGYELVDVAYSTRRIQQNQGMAHENNAAKRSSVMLSDMAEILTFRRMQA